MSSGLLLQTSGGTASVSVAVGAALVKHLPQGQHLHLENAGHLMMAEYPEDINQALFKFRQNATELT